MNRARVGMRQLGEEGPQRLALSQTASRHDRCGKGNQRYH
jgi:hypothetical protein